MLNISRFYIITRIYSVTNKMAQPI